MVPKTDGGGTFLEAGAGPCVLAPVRPIATRKKGLSQQEADEEVIITVEGEVVPRGGAERLAAEGETCQNDEMDGTEPALGAMASDLLEEELEETCEGAEGTKGAYS